MTLLSKACRTALLVLLLAPGCSTRIDQPFRLHADGVDPDVTAAVRADLEWARRQIEGTLGSYPDTVNVHVFPNRAGFTAALQEAWGIRETACWMVGAADDQSLFLLSPGVWKAEACEHNPDDAGHMRRLITHEAVHVYHGQVNPSEDIGLLEDIGWFSEGLATYLSGQLDVEHAGRAAEALASDAGPADLATAWSGPYRYGVCGSMVAYVDARWGRDTLKQVMRATNQTELLTILSTTEAVFLADWRESVRSQDHGRPRDARNIQPPRP